MATCNLCQAQYNWGENPCWRCEQDNSFWEKQEDLSELTKMWRFFSNVWGGIAAAIVFVSFVLLLITIILAVAPAPGYGSIIPGVDGSIAPIMGQFLAWFMSFVSSFVIYATRLELWNYSWTRYILKPRRPSLYMIAVILFLLAVLLLLTYFTLWQFIMISDATSLQRAVEPVNVTIFDILLRKIVMPGMWAFIATFFALGSMFMSAGSFVARLNEEGGQPIFMNTRLLTDVVQRATAESLELPLEATKPSAIKRTENGGINMIINYFQSRTDPDSHNDTTDKIQQRYEAEANMWGQISSLIEKPLPPSDKDPKSKEETQQ